MGNSQEEETPFGGLFGQTLIERQIAQIEITQDERGIDWGLPEEEKAVLNKLVLEPLSRPSEPDEIASFIGSMMVCGFSLGFLPSECLNSLKRASLRAVADQSVPVTLDDSELNFWLGCALYMQRDYLASRDLLQKVKDNALLPRKILLASLQLCAWSQFHLLNYNEALETLNILKARVSTAEGKERASFLIGYLSALWEEPEFEEFPLGPEVHVVLPEEEYDELLLEKAVPLSVSSWNNLRLILEEQAKSITLSIWKAKEEVISRIPNARTLEEVNERLAKEYGDWIKRIQNPGALVNAEFLYGALKSRSWGEVVVGYANAVELETKARLEPLLGLLKSKGILEIPTKDPRNPIRIDSPKVTLGEIEIILCSLESNPALRVCTENLIPTDLRPFLLDRLPRDLEKLRNFRNSSAHGEVIQSAKEIRKLVLGTPEEPGLLKRLSEVNFKPIQGG